MFCISLVLLLKSNRKVILHACTFRYSSFRLDTELLKRAYSTSFRATVQLQPKPNFSRELRLLMPLFSWIVATMSMALRLLKLSGRVREQS
jgi:hypothetical protein